MPASPLERNKISAGERGGVQVLARHRVWAALEWRALCPSVQPAERLWRIVGRTSGAPSASAPDDRAARRDSNSINAQLEICLTGEIAGALVGA